MKLTLINRYCVSLWSVCGSLLRLGVFFILVGLFSVGCAGGSAPAEGGTAGGETTGGNTDASTGGLGTNNQTAKKLVFLYVDTDVSFNELQTDTMSYAVTVGESVNFSDPGRDGTLTTGLLSVTSGYSF